MKEFWKKRKGLISGYFTTNIYLMGVVLLVSWPLLLWAVPLFNKWGWPILGSTNTGYAVTFILLIMSMLYVVKRVKLLIYILSGAVFLGLTYTTISGNFSYKDMVKEYISMVGNLQNKSQLVSVMSSQYEPFVDAAQLRELISEKSSETRNFAVKAATKHFQDVINSPKDRKLIQYLSVFKEINSKWVYVADPEGEEYFASPHETIKQLSIDEKFNGDCDDHAILMAASLKFVGAKVRLVRTPTHVYPELKIDNKNELRRIVDFIRSSTFNEEAYGNSIFHHTDPNGVIWLNFDYTNKYPGGKFLDDNIVGILEF